MARKSGGGCFKALVVTLIVLLALAIGLDRAGDYAAERVASQRLASTLNTSTAPSVQIGGFPFLTQVAAHKLDQVEIAGRDLKLDTERPGAVSSVQFKLRGVGLSSDYSLESADILDGQALVEWPQATALVGHEMRYAGQKNGRGAVEVDSAADLGGQQVTFRIVAVPVVDVDKQLFTLEEASIDLSGYQLPAEAVRELTRAATQPVPLETRMGLKVTSMEATASGLQIGMHGDAIRFSR